jgi:kanamycin nucleotidyltransferase
MSATSGLLKGPQPHTHFQRLQLAQEIAAQIHQHYGRHLLALGLYGSLGRGSDGPYSDIEMHCVLHGVSTIDIAHEWSAGPWKAEVDVYDEETVLETAALVEGDWPLTHGAFVHVRPLYDPTGFFPRLRHTALTHPDETFNEAITSLIVGELYEYIGKIRNAKALNNPAALPAWTIDLARHTAYLIGLANRHLYTTSSTLLAESLTLPGRPAGYDPLCHLALSGRFTDSAQLVTAANHLWDGITVWAAEHHLPIIQDLPSILATRPFTP